MNSKNIIQKCKENNYNAQLEVYNSYKNMMYGVAIRILNSRAEAEDVVQESFIKGFQKIHQLDNETNLGAWLKRIVINNSLDVVRKKKKTIWVDDLSVIENIATEMDEEVYDNISIGYIKNCIQNLKDKYRIIVTLYMVEDYNHREISELLKINESTVRNQYKRGKDKLLKMLKVKQTG